MSLNWNVPLKNGKDVFFSEESFNKFTKCRTFEERFLNHLEDQNVSKEVTGSKTGASLGFGIAQHLAASAAEHQKQMNTRMGDGAPDKQSVDDKNQQRFHHVQSRLRLAANITKGRQPPPRKSSMSHADQKLYLSLYSKYGGHSPADPTEEEIPELNKLKVLQVAVMKEQEAYHVYARSLAGALQAQYKYMDSDARKYIEDRLTVRRKDTELYPSHYNVHSSFPLSGAGQIAQLTYGKCLLELGAVPKITVPMVTFDLRQPLPVDTAAVKHEYPIMPCSGKEKHWSHEACSFDQNAEILALQHRGHIVISPGALMCLVDNHAPSYSREWELPFTVREYDVIDGDKKTRHRVVYIDKPFVPTHLTEREKNTKFYKFLLKHSLSRHLHKGQAGKADVDKTIPGTDTKRSPGGDKQQGKVLKDVEVGVKADIFDMGDTSMEDMETFGTSDFRSFSKKVKSKTTSEKELLSSKTLSSIAPGQCTMVKTKNKCDSETSSFDIFEDQVMEDIETFGVRTVYSKPTRQASLCTETSVTGSQLTHDGFIAPPNLAASKPINPQQILDTTSDLSDHVAPSLLNALSSPIPKSPPVYSAAVARQTSDNSSLTKTAFHITKDEDASFVLTPIDKSSASSSTLHSGNMDISGNLVSMVTPSDLVAMDTPASPVSMETPTSPVTMETPASPVTMETPTSHVSTETPASPVSMETPASPVTMETPASPVTMETPTSSDTMETPASPTVMDTPSSPVAMETPASPVAIETPVSPTVDTPLSPTEQKVTPDRTGPKVIPIGTTSSDKRGQATFCSPDVRKCIIIPLQRGSDFEEEVVIDNSRTTNQETDTKSNMVLKPSPRQRRGMRRRVCRSALVSSDVDSDDEGQLLIDVSSQEDSCNEEVESYQMKKNGIKNPGKRDCAEGIIGSFYDTKSGRVTRSRQSIDSLMAQLKGSAARTSRRKTDSGTAQRDEVSDAVINVNNDSNIETRIDRQISTTSRSRTRSESNLSTTSSDDTKPVHKSADASVSKLSSSVQESDTESCISIDLSASGDKGQCSKVNRRSSRLCLEGKVTSGDQKASAEVKVINEGPIKVGPAIQDISALPIAVKKRGRPRKVPPTDTTENQTEPSLPPAVTETPVTSVGMSSDECVPVPPKKKRGRPPKKKADTPVEVTPSVEVKDEPDIGQGHTEPGDNMSEVRGHPSRSQTSDHVFDGSQKAPTVDTKRVLPRLTATLLAKSEQKHPIIKHTPTVPKDVGRRSARSCSGVSTFDSILQGMQEMLHTPGSQGPEESTPPDVSTYKRPVGQSNVSYHLWSLGAFQLVVRCGYHGTIKDDLQKLSNIHLCTKMEYQSTEGLEKLTTSETSRSWISGYIRPHCKLLRARVDPLKSELIAIEEVGLNQLICSQQIFRPGTAFLMLQNVFHRLHLQPPGQYLLHHGAGEKHCQIKKSTENKKRGSYDLHFQHFGFMAASVAHGNTVPWLPIDPSIILPHHLKTGRVPATFEPTDYTTWIPPTKKNKGRKKKKKQIKVG